MTSRSETHPPVAVFGFRRPRHLEATLAALARSEGAASTDLYVFIDAPRREEWKADQARVVEIAHSATGFRSLSVIVRVAPLGLAGNLVSGITEVVEKHGTVIVVEDDIVVGPAFLEFMRRGLDTYQDDPKVASIHGWVFPTRVPLPTTFFLRGADCWGWATWRDRWACYEADGRKLRDALHERRLTRAFDWYGAYPYSLLLEQQIAGLQDSWAIRWHASCFLRDMVTLFPGRSQVQNIGFDGDGATHSGASADYDVIVAEDCPPITRHRAVEDRRAVATIWGHLIWRRLRRRLMASAA